MREQISDFALHLSTQGTVYNIEGVRKAKELGFSRIFSRGGFAEGYLHGNPKKYLMSGDLSKYQGIYIGIVGPGGCDQRKNTGDDQRAKRVKGRRPLRCLQP